MNYKLTKKTKSINGEKLYRIQAVKDIPSQGVKKGDLGGWIGKNAKLLENAWIRDNAMVYGNAQVYGNANIFDNAHVFGNAHVLDWALVFGNANVYGNARICHKAYARNNANVYDNAEVFGNASVHGNAHVRGKARILGTSYVSADDVIDDRNSVINITTFKKHPITITKKYVYLGCKEFTRKEIKNNQLKLALVNGFTKEEYKICKEIIKNLIKMVK